MIDGLVQNHISFNWAQGLTDEQMLIDVERIEVVQGPGSSLYGAQAVSGIVHIITKNNVQGTNVKVSLGEDNTNILELLHGGQVGFCSLSSCPKEPSNLTAMVVSVVQTPQVISPAMFTRRYYWRIMMKMVNTKPTSPSACQRGHSRWI